MVKNSRYICVGKKLKRNVGHKHFFKFKDSNMNKPKYFNF